MVVCLGEKGAPAYLIDIPINGPTAMILTFHATVARYCVLRISLVYVYSKLFRFSTVNTRHTYSLLLHAINPGFERTKANGDRLLGPDCPTALCRHQIDPRIEE